MIIAIDGPAGAGKSTVARGVAAVLGATYLDSGAMYRVVALKVLLGEGPEEAAEHTRIGLGASVTADGVDVSESIRTPEVTSTASEIAALPGVRAALVHQQRSMLHDGGDWVAEGRDIGSVVAPDAEVKVYLTASPEERARRRSAESGQDYTDVLGQILERDERDSTREESPLVRADDSVELDTTGMTIEQVIEQIAALAREQRTT
jgi:cytidylate kinase